MDKTTKQEQNHEGPNEENQKNGEYHNHSQRIRKSESKYRLKQNKINSNSQQNQKGRTHSRSRSPCATKNSKHLISSNAFINFVQDFRENYSGMRSTKVFQMAGEKWKEMSSQEKQPYIKAAMSIKSQKQNQQKLNNITKLVDTNIEQTKNENTQKQEKPGKKERKKKPLKKTTKKKKSYTESDTESATSGTGGTSEDLSDLNS